MAQPRRFDHAGALEVRNGKGTEVSFKAHPEQRLDVIRAIEQAGATIEEFHSETPDWEALLRRHLDPKEQQE